MPDCPARQSNTKSSASSSLVFTTFFRFGVLYVFFIEKNFTSVFLQGLGKALPNKIPAWNQMKRRTLKFGPAVESCSSSLPTLWQYFNA